MGQQTAHLVQVQAKQALAAQQAERLIRAVVLAHPVVAVLRPPLPTAVRLAALP